VALLCDATTPRQRSRQTTLLEAAVTAAQVPQGSATLVVIGPVVALGDLLSPWLENAPAARPTMAPAPLALEG
jgi:siroheme synthase